MHKNLPLLYIHVLLYTKAPHLFNLLQLDESASPVHKNLPLLYIHVLLYTKANFPERQVHITILH